MACHPILLTTHTTPPPRHHYYSMPRGILKVWEWWWSTRRAWCSCASAQERPSCYPRPQISQASSLISLPNTLCQHTPHEPHSTSSHAVPQAGPDVIPSVGDAPEYGHVLGRARAHSHHHSQGKSSGGMEGGREAERQRDCVYTVGTRPWTTRSVDGQGEGEWAGPERAGLMCLVQH